MPKGYTNATLVAQELGRALSGDEQAQATGLIEEAEAFIDRDTGRAWLVTSPVTDELHVLRGPLVYLANAPVVAVTAVAVRSAAIGAATTTLAAGSGYELLDPAAGLLAVGTYPGHDVVINTTSYGDDALLTVSYSFTSALPADIRRATTLLVASWMRGSVTAALTGVESISVGQGDLSVKYQSGTATQASTSAVPATVQGILRLHRRLAFA